MLKAFVNLMSKQWGVPTCNYNIQQLLTNYHSV